MKLFYALTVSLVYVALPAYADPPKIKDLGQGVYRQEVTRWFGYIVDIETQQCFVRGVGASTSYSLIPCKNLGKRAEWKEIISWVEN